MRNVCGTFEWAVPFSLCPSTYVYVSLGSHTLLSTHSKCVVCDRHLQSACSEIVVLSYWCGLWS
jgi:hypothetical protein